MERVAVLEGYGVSGEHTGELSYACSCPTGGYPNTPLVLDEPHEPTGSPT